MYYKVIDEICENGAKSRYCKGQTLTDSELTMMMEEFKDYKFDIYDELKKKRYEFYYLNKFRQRFEYYKLFLNKLR